MVLPGVGIVSHSTKVVFTAPLLIRQTQEREDNVHTSRHFPPQPLVVNVNRVGVSAGVNPDAVAAAAHCTALTTRDATRSDATGRTLPRDKLNASLDTTYGQPRSLLAPRVLPTD